MRATPLLSRLGRAGLLAVVLATLLVAGVAFAAMLTAGDGFVDAGGNFFGGGTTPILIAQSESSGGCVAHQGMVALKFDLSSIGSGSTIFTATVSVHVDLSTLPGTGNLVVVPVADTTFTTTNGTLSPSSFILASPLVTATYSGGVIQGITGSSDLALSSPQLAGYFNGQKGGPAAIGLVITGCSAGNPSVQFTSSSGSVTTNHPTLTLTGPNAVSLATLRTSRPQAGWPLAGVLVALGLAVAGFGLLLFRKLQAMRA